MGYFIDTQSVESLVNMIEALMTDKQSRIGMSKFNREFAKVHFSSEKVVEDFLSI